MKTEMIEQITILYRNLKSVFQCRAAQSRKGNTEINVNPPVETSQIWNWKNTSVEQKQENTDGPQMV